MVAGTLLEGQNSVRELQKSVASAGETLSHLQLRLQVVFRRRLTHSDLAMLAGTSRRSMDEWMRGATPASMTALLRLLGRLPPNDVDAVLAPWREPQLSADAEASHPLSNPH
jgi:hypothetical protein